MKPPNADNGSSNPTTRFPADGSAKDAEDGGAPEPFVPPLPTLDRGTIVEGKYRLEQLLGRGSMGVVFLASDTSLERRVAIKLLHPNLCTNRGTVERFRREAMALAKIRHENVVEVYTSGDHEGVPYFVMEYLPGYTVAGLLDTVNQKGEALYVDVVLGIVRQVARGLQHMHEAGIVHRDVKPANMLVGPRFRVAITDFGLVESLERLSSGGSVTGTPVYLAPEVILRQELPERERHLCDIYALGVTTYELLVGDVPFGGANIQEILNRHVSEEPPAVSLARADLPKEMDEVLKRAMAKNPANRQRSCQELVHELDRARGRADDQALPAGAPRILVVDDDSDLREIYTATLHGAFPDALVLAADDGLSALELAKAYRPSLILLDLNMPRLNGLELCAALRVDRLTAAIPIVVITGTADEAIRKALRAAGVKAIELKPIEPRVLVGLVTEHLGRSKLFG
jgi:eukaryotic-like serine/threonine-protein kinase